MTKYENLSKIIAHYKYIWTDSLSKAKAAGNPQLVDKNISIGRKQVDQEKMKKEEPRNTLYHVTSVAAATTTTVKPA